MREGKTAATDLCVISFPSLSMDFAKRAYASLNVSVVHLEKSHDSSPSWNSNIDDFCAFINRIKDLLSEAVNVLGNEHCLIKKLKTHRA